MIVGARDACIRILLRAHGVSELHYFEGRVMESTVTQRWIVRGSYHAFSVIEKQMGRMIREKLSDPTPERPSV